MKAVYRKLTGMFFALMFASASVVCVGCSDGGSDGGSPAATPATPDSKGGDEKGDGGQGGDGKNPSAKKINLSDAPVGYASVTAQTGTGTTVTTRAELLNAISKGGLIYVSGMIDMSEGCLPSVAGGSTTALDEFVKTKTSSLHSNHGDLYPAAYNTYEEFKKAYAGLCSKNTDDKSSNSTTTSLSKTLWKLNSEYGNKIKLKLKSDTTIIGLQDAVIKGGTFQISGVSNVIMRNLTIKDAYDPFPHHENGDGFNAQWDGIAILDNSENIWIDHCTFEDTMKYSNVKISDNSEEKWQTYDGLCDITKGAKNVVVSYCVFKNHDKTMLIGSGSTDLSGGNITIHHNRFLNCGQRLPMTCYPNMHIFNNSYERDSNAFYDQKTSIAARYGAYTIIAENNYFGSGVKFCISKSTSPSGKCYESGNVFTSRNEDSSSLATQSEKPFEISYSCTLDDASKIKEIVAANAGAGCTLAD